MKHLSNDQKDPLNHHKIVISFTMKRASHFEFDGKSMETDQNFRVEGKVI